jgi:ribosomal protein L7/L12
MKADQLITLVRLTEEEQNPEVLHHLKKALRVGMISYTRDQKERGLQLEEIEALRAGRRIYAIKLYKNRKGCDLLEAKTAVERGIAELLLTDKGYCSGN